MSASNGTKAADPACSPGPAVPGPAPAGPVPEGCGYRPTTEPIWLGVGSAQPQTRLIRNTLFGHVPDAFDEKSIKVMSMSIISKVISKVISVYVYQYELNSSYVIQRQSIAI